MLNKIKNRKQEGFTIIEVLIVLAIAGLIMLIVFLAVPALQRNSRNTQRTSEVGRVGSAVADYVTNNNGKIPSSVANLDSIKNSVGEFSQFKNAVTATGALSGNKFSVTTGAQAAPTIAKSAGDAIAIVTKAECDVDGATKAGTNERQIAIQYTVEQGNQTNFQVLCKNV